MWFYSNIHVDLTILNVDFKNYKHKIYTSSTLSWLLNAYCAHRMETIDFIKLSNLFYFYLPTTHANMSVYLSFLKISNYRYYKCIILSGKRGYFYFTQRATDVIQLSEEKCSITN